MCDREHRECQVPLHGCTASAQRQTDAVEARMQYEEPGREQQEELRRSLHSLEEWVCDLLIRNQELRMSLLASASNHQSGEADQ